jgi:hypothetical protein
MLRLLDPLFIYITDCCQVYDRDNYIQAVGSHQLSYSGDLELIDTGQGVGGDVVILVGMMHGHARLRATCRSFAIAACGSGGHAKRTGSSSPGSLR